MIGINRRSATETTMPTALPALKSRARLKCRSAAGKFRPGFDDVWEINATTAESHLLPSVRLPNSWLQLFLKDHKSAPLFFRVIPQAPNTARVHLHLMDEGAKS